MKTRYVLIILSILLISCGKNSDNVSQLRMGQFLLESKNVRIILKKENEEKYSEVLKYGDLTEYKEFETGNYEIEVSNDGKTVLQKKFGIGKGGLYSLILYGIPQKNQAVNFQSTKTKLLDMVKGTEARSANAFMPQFSILNDKFEIGSNEAKLRWVHLAPGVNEINAKGIQNSNETDLGKITYPETSEETVLKPLDVSLGWYLQDEKVQLAQKELKISASTLYTIFVVGNTESYLNNLEIIVGETPKKEF